MPARATVSLSQQFPQITAEVLARVPVALTRGAEQGLTFTLAEAPEDEGTLRGSGGVEPATDPESGAVVYYDTPYAARLHEHPEYDFSTDANPGAKGKYVEDPMFEHKQEIGDTVAATMRGEP